jgi:hypothetical protein
LSKKFSSSLKGIAVNEGKRYPWIFFMFQLVDMKCLILFSGFGMSESVCLSLIILVHRTRSNRPFFFLSHFSHYII